MSDFLPLAVAIGLGVSLLFSELFGLAAGGMVVPGYIAMHLNHPVDVLLTVAAGLATFAIVHLLASITILYGRRRTVLMILVGYVVGELIREFFTSELAAQGKVPYEVIGFIIPGLIAIWVDRQGVVETVSTLVTAAVVVRILMLLIAGAELMA